MFPACAGHCIAGDHLGLTPLLQHLREELQGLPCHSTLSVCSGHCRVSTLLWLESILQHLFEGWQGLAAIHAFSVHFTLHCRQSHWTGVHAAALPWRAASRPLLSHACRCNVGTLWAGFHAAASPQRAARLRCQRMLSVCLGYCGADSSLDWSQRRRNSWRSCKASVATPASKCTDHCNVGGP